MTKALTLFFFLTLFAACSNNSGQTTEPKVQTVAKKTHNVEQVLTKYMQAWADHDKAQIESYYADDVIWYDLPSDQTTKGKAKVGTAITGAFLDNVQEMYWVKSGDSFISGHTITYEWVYGGIYSGKWGDVTIDHKKFAVKGISTTSIDSDGKINSQKDYYDFYGYQKQLGLVE